MNILSLEHLTHSYTERKLFDDADFYLHEGDKVGVIGINGTGKSTLLKIMAGLETPDEGQVIQASNLMIHYLPQNPEFEAGRTVLDCVIRENMAHEHAWDLEGDAKSMLNKLGITDYSAKVETLSGGQRKRVALAAVLLSTADLLILDEPTKRLALISVLLSPADILLLDEPTNHLDNDMADWLEEYLKKFRGALLMITHDRYFLDNVTNRIVELDKGKLYSYQSGYEGYLELKAEREAMAVSSEQKRQNILRKELEWIRRGAKARTTKQKGRIQRYEKLKDQDAPQTDGSVEISSISSRMGKTTVELSHISKSYDSRVLIRDFTYIFLKNDRIGFVGANGSGKTTLMKIIDQRIQPDEGTVTIGQTIKIGYYTQEIENTKDAGIAYMDPNEKVIDYIKNTAEFVRTKDGLVSASNMLERFLFPSSQQYSPIGKLSGGEKRRLNLLRVLMEAPNVLILDEPTNDLDIRTLTILEDYLDNYDGIVITVSHDRYFLDRVVNRIFAFEEDGKICQYEGGYTDYVNRLAEEGKVPAGHILDAKNDTTTSVEKENQTSSMDTWKRERKLKFSYKEQKEYETIEDDIAALEQKIEELDAQTLKFSSDFVKLNEITKEKEQTEQLLEEKMERWEYLEDLAAKIAGQQ